MGTNDNNPVNIITNSINRISILSGGQVGIGNNSPTDNGLSLYKTIDGNSTWSNLDAVLVVNSSGTGSYHQGQYVGVRANHPSGTLDLLRNYNTCEMTGDGVLTECYGNRAITRLFDYNAGGNDTTEGTIVNGFGLEAYVGTNTISTGKIRNATGIYISRAHATGDDPGSDHKAVGLRIDNIVASGGDNNQALSIWSNTTALSVFNGPIQTPNLLPVSAFSGSVGTFDTPYDSIYAGGFKAKVNGYEFAIYPGNMNQNMRWFMPTSHGTAGQAWVEDGTGVIEPGSVSDVQIKTPSTQPTCTSQLRGKVWNVEGGSGVADQPQMCIKNSSDIYVWYNL